jgi:transcription initiation factor TFIID subunit 10
MNKFQWSEELSDFLSSLDNYSSTIPEAVVKYQLQTGGLEVNDNRICKLVSLAADKFLTDIIYESKQISLLRQQASKGKRKIEMSETLEVEDLQGSLAQIKIFLRNKHVRTEDPKTDS